MSHQANAESPLVRPSRNIPQQQTLLLYVRAGGRCELDGCNRYLLEHDPTEAAGNFAERAHIYPFKQAAARGLESGRPDDIHRLENLILLCPACHHLVDTVSPGDYPVARLRQFKREHEDRVFSLTELSKDRATVPLVLRGLVGGRTVDISDEEMQAAVAPNHIMRRKKIEIDLTNLRDVADEAYWRTAAAAIDRNLERLFSMEPRPDRTLRLSVFALAPIPLLVHLGLRLSDKMEVDLYQRHRDPETWAWRPGPGDASFSMRCLVDGGQASPVALFINLSGKNPVEAFPAALGVHRTVYEITLEGQDPNPLFLNTSGDLGRFTVAYIRALATIRQAHPTLAVLHLFPAVPAPVAVTIGRARLPKVDAPMLVYDRDARAGGFVPTLEIK